MNRIQFQPDLSMPEFFKLFGTEALCSAALESARWPDGFRCSACGGAAHCVLRTEQVDLALRRGTAENSVSAADEQF